MSLFNFLERWKIDSGDYRIEYVTLILLVIFFTHMNPNGDLMHMGHPERLSVFSFFLAICFKLISDSWFKLHFSFHPPSPARLPLTHLQVTLPSTGLLMQECGLILTTGLFSDLASAFINPYGNICLPHLQSGQGT